MTTCDGETIEKPYASIGAVRVKRVVHAIVDDTSETEQASLFLWEARGLSYVTGDAEKAQADNHKPTTTSRAPTRRTVWHNHIACPARDDNSYVMRASRQHFLTSSTPPFGEKKR